jgi:hypothetical protein
MLLQQVCPAKLKHNKKGKKLGKKTGFLGCACLWVFEADKGVRVCGCLRRTCVYYSKNPPTTDRVS